MLWPTAVEQLDLFSRTDDGRAILVFLHGGAWRRGTALDHAFPAEVFVAAGAHYVVPDFAWVQDVGGNLATLVDQIRRAIVWVYRNAKALAAIPIASIWAGTLPALISGPRRC